MPDSQPATPGRLPAVYLGHGAPTLIDDTTWPAELAAWAAAMPRPKSILVVSAHWQSAPLTLGATDPAPLVYDFYGFPERYYQLQYDSPGAPELAERVMAVMPADEPVAQRNRGLDHGAFIPLLIMYPDAEIPILQMSMPDLDPAHLFAIGRRLVPAAGLFADGARHRPGATPWLSRVHRSVPG